MKSRVLVFLAAFGLMVGTATPQTMVHRDVRSVLQAASTAMGADNLGTIQFSGNGTTRALGQSFSTDNDWPTFDMPSYTRVIDYDANYSREDFVRTQGNNPPLGGGGTPVQGEDRRSLIVNGDYAWDIRGDNVVALPAAAEQRLIEILVTPHGFIKAAMEAPDTTAVTMMMAVDDPNIGQDAGPGGRKVTYVAFTVLDKYKVVGAINDRNLVERAHTWIPHPALGDLYWQWDYREYRDFGDVMFPGNLHQHTGYRRENGHHGHNIFVTDVRANPSVTLASVPDTVRQAAIQPVRVESQQLANGVWLIAGGSHNSVAVEFSDFVTVIEAPLNEERSLAVIQEVQRLIPNKMIRYLVVTHHHTDHSGGIRTYAAHGAMIVTHEANRDFIDERIVHPHFRRVEPDILSTYYPRFAGNNRVVYQPVRSSPANSAKTVLSDGTRTLELHPVQDLAHVADMLIAYLPTEKILVNADMYSPLPTTTSNASTMTLHENIERLKLDVERHAGIHGGVGTHDAFLNIVGATGN